MARTIIVLDNAGIEVVYNVSLTKEEATTLVENEAEKLIKENNIEKTHGELITRVENRSLVNVRFKLETDFFYLLKRHLNKVFESNPGLIKDFVYNIDSFIKHEVHIYDSDNNDVEKLILSKAARQYLMRVLHHRRFVIERITLTQNSVGLCIFKDAVEEVKSFCRNELVAMDNFYKTFSSLTLDKPKDDNVSLLKAQLLAETTLYDAGISEAEVKFTKDDNPYFVVFRNENSSAKVFAKIGNPLFRKDLLKLTGKTLTLKLHQEGYPDATRYIADLDPSVFIRDLSMFVRNHNVSDVTLQYRDALNDTTIHIRVNGCRDLENAASFFIIQFE